MDLDGKRVLFISYNGMLDPLGQSQVIPYLRELARAGVRLTLLSFERRAAFGTEGRNRCAELKRQLAEVGIEWHWLRYHQKPSLPATMYDVANGVRLAKKLVRRNRIELIHARSHIPATIALALKRRFGTAMIFDVRGLMADEYVDAGHWRKGSLSYRITKSMERRALSAADGIVTLTEKIWPIINQWDGLMNRRVAHEVVPCCADLKQFSFSQDDRSRRRQELGVDDRFVLVYSGSIDGWYLTENMADFFVALRKRNPRTYFLWLTPARHERVRALMRAIGVSEADYGLIAAAPSDVPSYLSASDAGLAFIKPCFSKLASSPTKYAEYLGCGLPLVINAGIGDSDALVTREAVGALISDFSELQYIKAATIVEQLANQADHTRNRTRKVAEILFDVRRVGLQRYSRLYETVLAKRFET